jgi:hypothetical protein
MYPESPGTYRISMDTILFLKTIVHFHSYERYKVLHTGRKVIREPPHLRSRFKFYNAEPSGNS